MIIIRADANAYIGTGHVMRCLSIAKAFARRGEEVLFATAGDRGEALIEQNGFPALCLDTDYRNMEAELERFAETVQERSPRLVLVDSYFATDTYLHALSAMAQTAYMDDFNEGRRDVDHLINYNIFAHALDYSKYDASGTALLLGPKYAPLRDEFRAMGAHKIDTPAHILVTAGGADPEHITEKIIAGICPLFRSLTFHVVAGALNPRLDKIKQEAERVGNVALHVNERNMSVLMKTCDIAISASGTTLYELCASGLPCITYTLADNQIMAAGEFERQGLMLNAGDCRGDEAFIDRLIGKLELLLRDEGLRRELSNKMHSIVDGRGADRIADALLQ